MANIGNIGGKGDISDDNRKRMQRRFARHAIEMKAKQKRITIIISICVGLLVFVGGPVFLYTHMIPTKINSILRNKVNGVKLKMEGFNGFKIRSLSDMELGGTTFTSAIDTKDLPMLKGNYRVKIDKIRFREKSFKNTIRFTAGGVEVKYEGLSKDKKWDPDKGEFSKEERDVDGPVLIEKGGKLLKNCGLDITVRLLDEPRKNLLETLKAFARSPKKVISLELAGSTELFVNGQFTTVDFTVTATPKGFTFDFDKVALAKVIDAIIVNALLTTTHDLDISDINYDNFELDTKEFWGKYSNISANIQAKDRTDKYGLSAESLRLSLDDVESDQFLFTADGLRVVSLERSASEDSWGKYTAEDILKDGKLHYGFCLNYRKPKQAGIDTKKMKDELIRFFQGKGGCVDLQASGVYVATIDNRKVDVGFTLASESGKPVISIEEGSLKEISSDLIKVLLKTALPQFVMKSMEFGDFEISLYEKIDWKDLRIELGPNPKERSPINSCIFDIGSIELNISKYKEKQFTFSIKGLNVVMSGKDVLRGGAGSGSSQYKISNADLSVTFPLDIADPAKKSGQMEALSDGFRDFFNDGKAEMNINFSGELAFSIKGQPFSAKIWTMEHDGLTSLVMDERSVKQIGVNAGMRQELTDAELKVFSSNPLRVPQLIWVANKAIAAANSVTAADPAISHDAYRHVYWSYLLATYFGDEFAEEVSDAHEVGNTTNTPAERSMDYTNNMVGRRYAREGYSESSILEHFKNDNSIIRSAG